MTDDTKPELSSTQMQMLQMLASVQRRVLAGELIGISFVVATQDRIPQHGYVAGPFTAGILAGGYLLAQADFVDFARYGNRAPVEPAPDEQDPNQLVLPL